VFGGVLLQEGDLIEVMLTEEELEELMRDLPHFLQEISWEVGKEEEK
jgi:hypothetical protein